MGSQYKRVSVTIQRSAVVVAMSLGLALPVSHGLSLGGERVVSYLGQPLRVEFPIESAFGERVESSCFALAPAAYRDGATPIRQGRMELSADGQRLIVRTVNPVEEPAIRIALDVGCETALRREFTILLDPAPVQRNRMPTETVEPRSAPEPAPGFAAAAAASVPPASAASAQAEPPREPISSQAPRRERRSAEARNRRETSVVDRLIAPRKAASQRRSESRLIVKGDGAAVDAASLAALAVPRLRVSSDLPDWARVEGTSPTAAQPLDELSAAVAKERRARLAAAPIEEDLPARLEADLVVAKKRLAEAQAQLATAGAGHSPGATMPNATASASNANVAAGKDAKNVSIETTKNKPSPGDFEWIQLAWLPGVLLLAGLGALWWRRRAATKPAIDASWDSVAAAEPLGDDDQTRTLRTALVSPTTPTMPSGAAIKATTTPAPKSGSKQELSQSTKAGAPAPTAPSVATAAATQAANEQVQKLDGGFYDPARSAASLDVTELSHITDEAQVYADLGRNTEAIEILAHHIDNYVGDRPSPAPWLMLFELFRKTDRRGDYDRLAPVFRKNFNGRLPEWENYKSELSLDDGLESFPHLISRIERDWGTPTVRTLLDELLRDNRGGSRLGFSLSAYKDLLLLLQVHDQLAQDGHLRDQKQGESSGANDDDGTPKWSLSLDMIEPPKPGELDEFLGRKPPTN